ncbi:MAG: hypothetical protein ACEY3J_01125 [Arsenophonus sp.]
MSSVVLIVIVELLNSAIKAMVNRICIKLYEFFY